MARSPKDKPPPTEPHPDTIFADQLRESCARAMAKHLKASVNTHRPINSLKLPEMISLAEACTSHWIVEVSKRMTTEDLSPTLREYKNLLYG